MPPAVPGPEGLPEGAPLDCSFGAPSAFAVFSGTLFFSSLISTPIQKYLLTRTAIFLGLPDLNIAAEKIRYIVERQRPTSDNSAQQNWGLAVG
jgi:hypothetical protein